MYIGNIYAILPKSPNIIFEKNLPIGPHQPKLLSNKKTDTARYIKKYISFLLGLYSFLVLRPRALLCLLLFTVFLRVVVLLPLLPVFAMFISLSICRAILKWLLSSFHTDSFYYFSSHLSSHISN